jgi:vitamin B12 transporter
MIFSGAEAAPIPKFGIVFYAADFLTLKNNYFRAFKFPNFNDLYWTSATEHGNPDLKPEDGMGADFTVELKLRDYFNLETTAFAQSIKNSIHWRSSGGILQPVNIGEAAYYGWDSRIRSDFSDWLFLSFSYQYLLTYILTGDFTYSSNIRMPYIPEHTAGASLEFRWKSGSLFISGHYEGMRYETYTPVSNVNEFDPYFLLHITLNQKLNENLTVFAAVRNALNQSYVSVKDYPMPGITLTLGLRAEYGGL